MYATQSPAFVAAVQTFCHTFERGTRDMRKLKPLIRKIDAAFVYQPGPKHAPLTEAEKQDTIKTWQQLDAAHDGQITELADQLLEMDASERARTIELWIAVMEVMHATPEATV